MRKEPFGASPRTRKAGSIANRSPPLRNPNSNRCRDITITCWACRGDSGAASVAIEAPMTREHDRLIESKTQETPWKKWGPYLSERQWGTVREDYSEGGDAWNYFSHDQARARAYRWGEDGLAGFSDNKQRL